LILAVCTDSSSDAYAPASPPSLRTS
jgi:hypothetical protein